jgi:hypothetical protein
VNAVGKRDLAIFLLSKAESQNEVKQHIFIHDSYSTYTWTAYLLF